MKRYLLTFFLVFCALTSFAQSHRYYCEIKGYEKGLTSNYKVIFDFGQKVSQSAWNKKSHKLKFVDENGKKIKFKSVIDAANFMSERGWFLQEAYSAPYSSSKSLKHWVFYKEASNLDEVKDGFLRKKDYRKLKREEKAAKKSSANKK